MPYIQKVYAQYDAESKVDNVHLPAERHDFGPSKRVVVYNFLAQYLGLNAGKILVKNQFDEAFITLLPKEDLMVFNEKSPIPANAIQGEEALMKYLNLKP